MAERTGEGEGTRGAADPDQEADLRAHDLVRPIYSIGNQEEAWEDMETMDEETQDQVEVRDGVTRDAQLTTTSGAFRSALQSDNQSTGF